MNISQQIKSAVQDSGLSLSAIAAAAGIPLTSLMRFMSGERGLTTATLDKLGPALGLAVTVKKPNTPAQTPRKAKVVKGKAAPVRR